MSFVSVYRCVYIYIDKVSIILFKCMRVYLKVHIISNVCIFIQTHMYMFANVGCKLKGLVGLVSLEEIPFSNQVSKTAGASSLSQDWVILAPECMEEARANILSWLFSRTCTGNVNPKLTVDTSNLA